MSFSKSAQMQLRTACLPLLAVSVVLTACGGHNTGSAPPGRSASSNGIPQRLCGVTWAGTAPAMPVAFNVARAQPGEVLHIPVSSSKLYLVVSSSCKLGVSLKLSGGLLSYRTIVHGQSGGAVMVTIAVTSHVPGRETLRMQPLEPNGSAHMLAIVVGHGLSVRITHR